MSGSWVPRKQRSHPACSSRAAHSGCRQFTTTRQGRQQRHVQQTVSLEVQSSASRQPVTPTGSSSNACQTVRPGATSCCPCLPLCSAWGFQPALSQSQRSRHLCDVHHDGCCMHNVTVARSGVEHVAQDPRSQLLVRLRQLFGQRPTSSTTVPG